MGQSVTHATIQPTQSPSWEELLLIEVGEEESKDEGKTSNCSVCCFSMNLFILKKVQKNWQAATTVTLRLLVCPLEMVPISVSLVLDYVTSLPSCLCFNIKAWDPMCVAEAVFSFTWFCYSTVISQVDK